MPRTLAVLVCLAALLPAVSEEPVPAPAAPHKGGVWVEVPGVDARLERVVAKDKKSAAVYSFEQDGKTPKGLKDAPELTIPALSETTPLRGRALNLKDGTATEFEFKMLPAGDGELAKEPPANRGPHGGEWIDIPGTKVYFELVHDLKLGRVTIWAYGDDGKTPAPLADAPVFNVDTPLDGFVQVDGKAVGLKDGVASRFDFEGADFNQRAPGGASRFTIRMDGKPYQAPIINREHGHMHGPGGAAAPK